MRIERCIRLAGFFVVVLILAGCGQAMSEVSGKVTVDGTPIDEGTISFYPADKKSQPAGGKIKDGMYSVQVPRGAMKVVISKPKVTGHKKLYPDDPKSKEYPVTKEDLPPKYSDREKTELKLDVTGGSQEKNWELSSK
jgi:hypothetical protein